MIAPPGPPTQDQLEALTRDARQRQQRRRVAAAAVVLASAGGALGVATIVAPGRSRPTAAQTASPRAPTSTSQCHVRVQGTKISSGGHVLYREPVPGNHAAHQMQCSGQTTWVVFFNGVAANQQGYVGVRSGDGGRTWRLIFAERFFGVKAPHQLDAYMGAWTLQGTQAAYFTGRCPACAAGTVSLWATRDGGRTFRRYQLPVLTGYVPTVINVSRNRVSIAAKRWVAGRPSHRTVRLPIS